MQSVFCVNMEGSIPLASLIFIFIQVLMEVRPAVLALGKNSTCSDGLGLNYTLPMFEVCRERPDENGKMVATIPKIIPNRGNGSCPNSGRARLSGHRQCRFPDCLSNPCKNGWCEETMVGFKCHCSEGYTGNSCGKLDKAAKISRNETQRTTTTKPTTQQSTTTPDFNECASNPCRNGGTCIDDFNRYLCQCVAGLSGVNCQINLNECFSQPCLHDGICFDGINSYTCLCGDGWAGTNCGIDIDECSDEPCENGGVCVDGLNSFTCTCTEGWEGSTCDINTNECIGDPCENGGACQDGNNSYTCQCTLGWEGTNCEINANDCVNDPCQNEGICLDGLNSYTCQCTDGWEGANCEINTNECFCNPCENGGSCEDGDNSYICQCTAGWEGTNCEINTNDCVNDPCQNEGICFDGLNSYTCQCTDGWIGINCENDIDECSSQPCGNQGICQDEENGYACACEGGWTGTHCETDIDECSSQPCGNQGICQDEVNSYTCACEDGWTGTNCVIPPCPSDWFYYGQKCYYQTSFMSWSDAHRNCSNLNVTLKGGAGPRRASLLLVESQEETEIIAKEFMEESMRRLWLNCNDLLEEGTWICEKDASGTVSSYRNWYPGQLNGNWNRDYAIMKNVTAGDVGKWFDRGNCSETCYNYIGTVCQVYL